MAVIRGASRNMRALNLKAPDNMRGPINLRSPSNLRAPAIRGASSNLRGPRQSEGPSTNWRASAIWVAPAIEGRTPESCSLVISLKLSSEGSEVNLATSDLINCSLTSMFCLYSDVCTVNMLSLRAHQIAGEPSNNWELLKLLRPSRLLWASQIVGALQIAERSSDCWAPSDFWGASDCWAPQIDGAPSECRGLLRSIEPLRLSGAFQIAENPSDCWVPSDFWGQIAGGASDCWGSSDWWGPSECLGPLDCWGPLGLLGAPRIAGGPSDGWGPLCIAQHAQPIATPLWQWDLIKITQGVHGYWWSGLATTYTGQNT